MKKIEVTNMKCEGCKNGIIASLENKGLKKVKIDLESQSVSFEGDEKIARELLNKMGYPEKNNNNFIKKMKSFFSCFKGKISK